MTRSLKIKTDRDTVDARLDMAAGGPLGILLAHGAGAGQHHEWMVGFRRLFAAEGLPVMTFDYAYTAQRRRAPDRMPRLLDVHAAAAERMLTYVDRVVFAGKSMGSRVGSHLADPAAEPHVSPAGLIAYGYPLVPMGTGEPRPTDHLARIAAPLLFFAGTRDRLSPPPAMAEVVSGLDRATLEVIDDGDHSLHVPKRSGRTNAETHAAVVATSATWLQKSVGPRQTGGGGR